MTDPGFTLKVVRMYSCFSNLIGPRRGVANFSKPLGIYNVNVRHMLRPSFSGHLHHFICHQLTSMTGGNSIIYEQTVISFTFM